MADKNGWIGIDLDGTLAEYNGWKGSGHIGKPIEKMANRLREWVADGQEVRIMTARASSLFPDAKKSISIIQDWLAENFGEEFGNIEVTNEKDQFMIELWDDRAVQLIPNTGERVDGK